MGQAKQRAAEISKLKANGPRVKPEAVSPTPTEEFKINPAQIETARRAQWKGAIEQELQALVTEATQIRKKIQEAKTTYKKELYAKKFTKVQSKVMQMVAALQRLEQQAKAAAEGAAPAPHVHDEHCGHLHEEEKQNETAPQPAST